MDSGPNQTQESESSARGRNKRQKSSNDGSRRPRGIRSKGIDALGFEPFTKDSTWVTKSDYDPDFPLIPSAKTTALKALLLKGFQEAPDDKVRSSHLSSYSTLDCLIENQTIESSIR